MPSAESTGVADSPRRRRPRGEPRRLLIAAAQDVFNRKGYSTATTREIADLADVSEPLMFRYFGTKSGLYREAMVEPFVEVVDRLIERRLADPQRFKDPTAEIRAFVTDLYELFHRHRALAVALFVVDTLNESELAETTVVDDVRAQIDRLVEFGIEEARLQGAAVSAAEHRLTTRAMLAMIAGFTTLGHDRRGRRPSRAAIVDEVTAWVAGRFLPAGS